jgi:hypothetical protein
MQDRPNKGAKNPETGPGSGCLACSARRAID